MLDAAIDSANSIKLDKVRLPMLDMREAKALRELLRENGYA